MKKHLLLTTALVAVFGISNAYAEHTSLGNLVVNDGDTINETSGSEKYYDSITINGGTFTNNTARIVAHQNGLGSLTITGGTFSQNDLTNETSAKSILYANYIRVVEGGTFSENKSPVFNLTSGDILRIDDGTFTGNTNGVVISQGNIDIRGGTFSENTADSGAVINASAGHIAIVGGTFNSNSSTGANTSENKDGGVIFLTGTATMEITADSEDTQPVFQYNTSATSGGVISLSRDSNTYGTNTFNDSTFGDNVLLIKAGKFIDNNATDGGAISVSYGTLTLGYVDNIAPLFDGNTASSSGGAISFVFGTLREINGTFTNNTTNKRNGGGLSINAGVSGSTERPKVIVGEKTVIKNNTAHLHGDQISSSNVIEFKGGTVIGEVYFISSSNINSYPYITGTPSSDSSIIVTVSKVQNYLSSTKEHKIVESTNSPWLYTSGMAGYSLVQDSNKNLYFATDSDIVAKVYLQSWGDRRVNFTSLADAITYANSLNSSASDLAVIDLQKDITISSQIAGLATQNKYIMLTSSKDVTATISTSQPFAEFQGNLFVNSINGSITFTSSLSSINVFRMSNANASLYIGSNITFDGINGTCILLFAGKGYVQGATFTNCSGTILLLAPNTGNSSAEIGDIVATNNTSTGSLITVGSGCSLTMNNGEFSGNTAPNGIVNIGSGATATINGAIMSGNTCTSGAIVNAGTLTIGSATFSGNTIDIAHRGTALNIDGDFEAKITVASGKDINVSSKLSSGKYTITPADYTAYPFDTTAIVNFTYTGVTAEEVATQKACFVSADTNYSFVQGDTNTTKLYLEKNITITFNVSDSVAGKVSPTTLTVPYNSTVSVSNNILTINNQTVTATTTTSTDSAKYAFANWSVADGTKITSSTTITANFTTQYKVTASVNTGDTTAKIAGDNGWTASGTSAYKWVNKGATIGTLPTGSRTGYTLAGFYTGATTGSQVSTSTAVSGAMTIYARWTANSVKVTYNTNGGLFNYAYLETKTVNGITFTYDEITNILTINGTNTGTNDISISALNLGTRFFAINDKFDAKLEIISGTFPVSTSSAKNPALYFWAMGDEINDIVWESMAGLSADKLNSILTIKNAYSSDATQGFFLQLKTYQQNYTFDNVQVKVTLTKSGVSSQETYMKFNSKYSTTMTTPVKDGYTFAGWYSDSGLTKRVNRTDTMNSTSPVTLYAKWTANSYHVTLNNSSATTAGTTDVYYRYRTAVNGKYYFSDAALTTALSGDTGTFITKPTKTGYTFAGYFTQQDGKGTQYVSANGEFINSIYWNVANNITLYAHWTANTDTAYKVEHYQMNLDGTNYTLKDTDNLTGTTGATTVAKAKTYTGFTAGTVTQTTIKADGTTVVRINYTRNSYKLTLEKGTGIESVTGANTYKFGASVTIDATVMTGYTWSNWTSGSTTVTTKKYTFTMPAGDLTYKANTTTNQYTLTINPNGGSWNGSTSNSTFTQNFGTTKVIANPTKTGSTFGGWELTGAGSFNSATNTFTFGAGNATLKAKWNINTYTVKVEVSPAGYGSVSTTEFKNVPYGSKITVSGNKITLNGTDSTATASANTAQYTYKFDSWSVANNATVTGDMTIKANFTRTTNKYTVTFVVNDATLGTVTPATIADVEYGKTITISGNKVTINGTSATASTKTISGYTVTFVNWTGASNGATVTGNLTITANFTKSVISYSITYDYAGGSLPSGKTNPTRYTVETATFTLNKPTKEGYTFAGWTGTGLTEATATVTITKGSTGNRSYTATWTVDSYKLTVTKVSGPTAEIKYTNANGIETTYNFKETETTKELTVKYGTTITITPSGNFANIATSNYKITGVTINGAKTAMSKAGSATATMPAKDITAVINTDTLYGFKVTTTANGTTTAKVGETSLTIGTQYYLASGLTVSVTATPNAGYIPAIDGDAGTVGTAKTSSFTTNTTAKVVAVTYSLSSYTVKVEVSPAGYGSVSTKEFSDVPYGSKITVSGNKITLNGKDSTATASANTAQYTYKFDNWSVANNATVTGDMTIKANFTRTTNKYTVTFVVNDATLGTVTPATIADVEYGKTITISGNKVTINGTSATASTKTISGYTVTFVNWIGTSNGATVTGNLTITANFTKSVISYSITYDYAGGSLPSGKTNPTSYTVEDAFTLNNPTKAGYTFAGWTGSNGTTAQTSVAIAKGSTGDRNYTANWTANPYNITLNEDGGTGASISPSATYSTSTSAQTRTLTNPSKTGYTFQKWTVSGDNASAKVEGTTLTIPANSYGNITLTAVWTVNSQGLTVQAYSNSVKDANFTYDENAVGGTVQINSGTAGAHATAKVDFNNKATITASANSHYKFVGWYKTDGTKVSDSASYEITMDATDVTYIARFEVITKTVTVNIPSHCDIDLATDDIASSDSSVSGSSTQKTFTFKEGATPKFEVTPSAGYRVSQIKVTLSSSGSAVDTLPYSEITDDGVKTYKFDGELFENGLMDNYTLTATIVARAYTVSFDTNGGKVNFVNMDDYLSKTTNNITFTYDPLTAILTADSNGEKAQSGLYYLGWLNFGEIGHFTNGETFTWKIETLGGATHTRTWGFSSDAKIWDNSELLQSGTYNYSEIQLYPSAGTKTLTVGGEDTYNAQLHGTRFFFRWYIGGDDVLDVRLNNAQYRYSLTRDTALSVNESVKINYGSTYKYKLPSAIREGYTFGGWYTDKNYTTRVTNVSTFSSTSDITLYAKWTVDSYTVTADANNGTVTSGNGWTVASDNKSATKSIEYNTAYGTLPTVTRDGYTFNGWYGYNNFDKSKYLLTSDYTSGGSYTYAAINLKPSTKYVVSVYRKSGYEGKNGYLLISPSKSINNNWTAVSHLTQPNATSTNYVFTTGSDGKLYIGYSSLDQSGLNQIWANTDVVITEKIGDMTGGHFNSATEYDSSYTPFIGTDEITSTTRVTTTANHKLQARWTINNYTITYNADGGEDVATTNYTVNDTITIPTTTKTGYTFAGWKVTTADGNWTADQTIAGGTTLTGKFGTVTLTAQWTANTYHVTLNNSNATTAGTTDAYYRYRTSVNGKYYFSDAGLTTALSGDTGTFITKPTKTGYIFAGYYTEQNGSGTQYVSAEGEFINSIYWNVASDITLYANWTANEISLADATFEGTYGEGFTTTAFAEATNGTGSYSYASVDTLPSGITFNSTNRTFTISNTVNAGTYTITIRATDNNSKKTATATMTIIVNRAKLATASGLTLQWNGKEQTGVTGENVTWSGTTKATDIGTYSATATPTSNYAWSDGTYSAKTITWKILKSEARIGSTYYETLEQAFASASAGTSANPTEIVIVASDISVQTIGFSKYILLTTEKGVSTVITRDSDNTGDMFVVTGGSFTIKGADADSTITLRGNRTLVDGTWTDGDTTGLLISGGTDVVIELDENVILENNYSTYGGAINVQAIKSLTVNGAVIQNNKGRVGGAICATGTSNKTINIISGSISNNTAVSGGAIYAKSTTITISGGTFDSNASTNNGGFINTESDVDITVTGGELTNTNTSWNGAFVISAGCSLTITGGKFNNNKNKVIFVTGTGAIAEISGDDTEFSGNISSSGGVFLIRNASLTINGGSFTNNSATGYYGGVIDTEAGATITINGGTFSGNTAKAYGGVINAVKEGTVINITGGIFTGNTGTVRAGVIFADSSAVVNISGTAKFADNKAQHGGVIYATSSAQINIEGGEFTGNTVSGNGAVVYVDTNSTATITAGTFTNNTANAEGGVIYLSSGTTSATITGGTFTGNKATTGGGVIKSATSAVVDITNATMTGNNGGNGGAISAWNSTVTLTDVNIADNTANYGSELYFVGGTTATISGASEITNTTTNRVGTVYIEQGTLNITGGHIKGTYALFTCRNGSATVENYNSVKRTIVNISGGKIEGITYGAYGWSYLPVEYNFSGSPEIINGIWIKSAYTTDRETFTAPINVVGELSPVSPIQVMISTYHFGDVTNYQDFTNKDTPIVTYAEGLTVDNDFIAFENSYTLVKGTDLSLDEQSVYVRGLYKLSLKAGEGIESVEGAGTYYYQQPFTIKATPKTGYSFKNWTISSANNQHWSEQNPITRTMQNYDIEFTANGIGNTYHVTLNSGDATTTGTTDAYYRYRTSVNGKYYFSDAGLTTALSGDEGTFITKPTKTGYTFAGYYTEQNGSGTQYVNADGEFINYIYNDVANNTTLYANWTADSFTIAFNGNNSTSGSMSSITATIGQSLTLPANTFERIGYTFSHWATKTTHTRGEKSYSDNATLSADDILTLYTTVGKNGTYTLYAHWTAITYTITYNSNGGTDVGSQTYTITTDLTLTDETPTKTNYTFTGWELAISVNNWQAGIYQTSQNVGTGKYGNITLVAQWKFNGFDITYNIPKPESMSNEETLYVNVLMRDQSYWNQAMNGEEKILNAIVGEFDVFPETEYTLGIPYRFKAVLEQYNIVEDTWSMVGTYTGIKPNDAGDSGLTFEHIALGQYITKVRVTLYRYSDNQCTNDMLDETHPVRFTPSDITNSVLKRLYLTAEISDSITVTYLTGYGFTLPKIFNTIYKFTGWVDGNGNIIESIPANQAEDLVLTATFEDAKYSLYYDLMGGSWNPDDNNSTRLGIGTVGSAIDLLPLLKNGKLVYQREGYTLVRFILRDGTKGCFAPTPTGYNAASVESYILLETIEQMLENGKSYYFIIGEGDGYLRGEWVPNTYTITFEGDGDLGGQTVDVKYLSTIELPTDTRKGYTFAGWWTTADNSGNEVTSPYTHEQANNITLFSHWTVNSYTITLDPNEGTVNPTSQQVNYGDELSLPIPTKTGYEFAGWKYTKLADYDLWDGTTVTAPTGTGTQADPYIISSGANLAWISSQLVNNASGVNNFAGVYFKQTRNIDLDQNVFAPIGQTFAQSFQGHYDGGNYVIDNLWLEQDGITATSYFGLFGYLGNFKNKATVENVILTNAHIDVSTNMAEVGKNIYVGGIAGRVSGAVINNIIIKGLSISISDSNEEVVHNVGGIAGAIDNNNTTVNNVSVQGSISYGARGNAGALFGGTRTPQGANNEYSVTIKGTLNKSSGYVGKTIEGVVEKVYSNGDVYDIADNVTFVAQWNIITYKLDVSVGYDFVTNPYDLTLALEDGQELHLTQSNKTGTLSHTYDSVNTYTVTLALNNPTTRYFIALYLDGNSVASNYTDLSKTSISFEWSPVKDGKLLWYIREVFEITAQPTTGIDTVQINYSYAGGNRTGTPSTTSIQQDVLYGFKHELVATVKQGYVFDGWYVNGSKVSSSLTYTVSSTVASVTYEARTTAIQSNVFFNNNDGSNVNLFNRDTFTIRENTAAFELVLEEGKTYTLTSNKPLQFVKISTGPNGYACGIDRRDVSFVTFKFERNSNIDAKYKLYLLLNTVSGATVEKSMFDGYEIKIEEGSTATAYSHEYKKVSYNDTYASLPTPTRAGYEFLGWFTDKTNGEKITDTSKVTITSDQTLYAHWKAKLKITINVNIDSGCDDNIMLVIKVYNVKTKETYSYSVSKSTTIILSGLEPSLYMISFVAPNQHTALVDGKSSKISALIDTDIIWNVKLNKTSSGGFGGRDTVN